MSDVAYMFDSWSEVVKDFFEPSDRNLDGEWFFPKWDELLTEIRKRGSEIVLDHSVITYPLILPPHEPFCLINLCSFNDYLYVQVKLYDNDELSPVMEFKAKPYLRKIYGLH